MMKHTLGFGPGNFVITSFTWSYAWFKIWTLRRSRSLFFCFLACSCSLILNKSSCASKMILESRTCYIQGLTWLYTSGESGIVQCSSWWSVRFLNVRFMTVFGVRRRMTSFSFDSKYGRVWGLEKTIIKSLMLMIAERWTIGRPWLIESRWRLWQRTATVAGSWTTHTVGGTQLIGTGRLIRWRRILNTRTAWKTCCHPVWLKFIWWSSNIWWHI